MTKQTFNRRDLISCAVALGLTPKFALAETGTMLTRKIPGTDESLPVIGLGTWEVFDVRGTPEEMDLRRQIVDLLIQKGGSLIDSSPMYNRSEKIIGDIIEAGSNRDELFLATKVWTNGKSRGVSQMSVVA